MISRSAVIAALALAACAQTGSKPAAEAEQRACAVLAGGDIGPRFTDEKVERFWFEVNRRITDQLQVRLDERYKAVKLIIEPAQRAEVRQRVGVELASAKCDRLLQVAHEVDTDGAGPFLRFNISLMATAPTGTAPGGSIVTTRGVYAKSYRFTRSVEALRDFSPSAFGDRAFADLEASGALEAIRR